MKNRPTSIIIISWFLIITSSVSVISAILTRDNPEVMRVMELNVIPVVVQYLLLSIGAAITIMCGILMLKANNIARIVYVTWTIFSLSISLLSSPSKQMLLPGLVFFLIITFFLFRPKANEYFSKTEEELLRSL